MQRSIISKTLYPLVRLVYFTMYKLVFWGILRLRDVFISSLYLYSKIDDVSRSVIMLINTIYFNGYWVEQFAKNQTNVQNFWLNSKATSSAHFMEKTGNFYYGESIELDAKILRLPYKVSK